MGHVSVMDGQGNCVSGSSPLTCVILHILPLPFRSPTLAPHISLSHSCRPICMSLILCLAHCTLLYSSREALSLWTGTLSHTIPRPSVLWAVVQTYD